MIRNENDQKLVRDFIKKYVLDSPIEYKFIDLVSEIGEIAKEMNLISNYGKSTKKISSELLEEIRDAYYPFLTIINHYHIDISNLLEKIIIKYEERLKKDSLGSQK